jgi:hypothetical protein
MSDRNEGVVKVTFVPPESVSITITRGAGRMSVTMPQNEANVLAMCAEHDIECTINVNEDMYVHLMNDSVGLSPPAAGDYVFWGVLSSKEFAKLLKG